MKVALQAGFMFVLAGSAAAQMVENNVQKFASSGQRSKFADFYALEADCSPVDWIKVNVVQQPEHGKAVLEDHFVAASYADPNPRKACNGRPVAAQTLFYTPDADYKGPDLVRVETLNSTGFLNKITLNISVQ